MEFNPRFAYNVMGVFNSSESGNPGQLEMNLSLDSNNVFRRSLVIEVNNDEVEIPVIAREHFEKLVSDNMAYPAIVRIKRIILPLYDNAPSQERRTFDSIIAQLFTNVRYGKRLQKITTNKGEVYYGGKGIIFDESYTPLLLCTLTARSVYTEDNGNAMVYYRPLCHVSPKVFLESGKLINKGIIKKLIPYYTSRDINFPRNNYSFSSNPEDRKVKVIVDNFNKFFVEPIKPTPSACSNDALNECLIDNIDDIMMLI
ncbi:hypothetical protein [Fusobacterium sp.]|uniref:hypothetical protein n=1 Tax=Fusobacterium sp. TaxID=68766 RepID=UPI002E77A9BC|nr:hypothetical protein [Fusobacterium sp.]MEE1476328.1 hypothetical protein [Fusobacterium sp.]